jgi:hypothetical protein
MQTIVSPSSPWLSRDLAEPAEEIQGLGGLGLAAFASFEILRKISQNFSPAGVTSPFVARAMPMQPTSVVPVRGGKAGVCQRRG